MDLEKTHTDKTAFFDRGDEKKKTNKTEPEITRLRFFFFLYLLNI